MNRCVLAVSVVLGCLLLWCRPVSAEITVVGSRLELFVDDRLIDRLEGVRMVLHRPRQRRVVFTFDAPWEGEMSAYPTVLKDGDEYRLYYRGGGELSREQACMAVSRDGLHWTRPELGLFEFEGSSRNNIIFMPETKAYREAHNFAPFVDTNPDVVPQERYKAVALGRLYEPDGTASRVLHILASPDGIHWKHLREEPVLTQGSFDSLNTVFWDENLGRYVCYLREGRDGVRSVQRSVSDDFIRWSEPEWLDFGPGPLEQFYTNGITPYFRDKAWYIGLPMRFVPQRNVIGPDDREVDGLSDAVLITSRDGLHFNRTFREAFIRPGPDSANWGNAHGNQTPAWGVVPGNAGEMWVYWAEHYGQTPRLVRGVLRVDGFASLQAPWEGGEAVTVPLTFEGDRLVLNYATSAVGSVRVEIQDAQGRPVPGFSLEEADELYGDETQRTVTWSNRKDVSSLAGRPVRLRLVMKDADLYSFRFMPDSGD